MLHLMNNEECISSSVLDCIRQLEELIVNMQETAPLWQHSEDSLVKFNSLFTVEIQ